MYDPNTKLTIMQRNESALMISTLERMYKNFKDEEDTDPITMLVSAAMVFKIASHSVIALARVYQNNIHHFKGFNELIYDHYQTYQTSDTPDKFEDKRAVDWLYKETIQLFKQTLTSYGEEYHAPDPKRPSFLRQRCSKIFGSLRK